MDDQKLFTRNKKELEMLINTTGIFNQVMSYNNCRKVATQNQKKKPVERFWVV